MRKQSRRAPLLALFVAAALAVGGCGGDDDDGGRATPPEDLSAQLVSPSDIVVGTKVKTDREFQWTDPIDFAFEGIFVPQSVPGAASKTVHALEDAGFESGAGEVMVTKDGSILAFVDVVKFDSEDGAAEARDYLNTNNLQQPCHGPCSVKPEQAEHVGGPKRQVGAPGPDQRAPSCLPAQARPSRPASSSSRSAPTSTTSTWMGRPARCRIASGSSRWRRSTRRRARTTPSS